MTSPADVVDLKGNTFGHTICPLSFTVIVLIFPELSGEGGGGRGGEGICPLLVPKEQKKPATE